MLSFKRTFTVLESFFPIILNIFVLSGNMLLNTSNSQDQGVSVGGTAIHLECNLGGFFDKYNILAVWNVFILQKVVLFVEKVTIACFAGEGRMLRGMEGLCFYVCLQVWTIESECMRIYAPVPAGGRV